MSRVMITGASTGIGRATAIAPSHRGHSVIATADGESVREAIAEAGQLDAIVSDAGATIRGTVEAIPLDEYERLLQLNFLGALRVAKAVLPSFRERRHRRREQGRQLRQSAGVTRRARRR